MASAGNPNQQQQQSGPFDMNKYFKPANLPHSPNPTNLASSPFLPASFAPTPSGSYPPPTGTYSYPPQSPPPYYNTPFPQDQQQQLQQQQASNYPHQRSVSFPTPPLQPSPPPQNPNAGARLMALLSAPPSNFDYSHQPTAPLPAIQPSPSGSSEFAMPLNAPSSPSVQPLHPINVAISHPAPMRMPSSKLPRGRHLVGDHVIYDVDVRLTGEVQPQLEVTPITKYVSDPGLILGHQIAVNKTYICYGLKLGAIRVLNINTALRSLLRGHTQRVTDMSFFAEDVHLLASASIDGRVYVWRISEGSDEEDKPQISGKIVIAIEIAGEEGPMHPRVCWHCHKQEILVVAIGRTVLRIDTTKVGRGEAFTAEQPLKCPLEKLIDGIQLVGKHDGEITDLSMCQWMTTRLVSASKDGTIKIWEDRKAQPLLVMRPHDGQAVDSAIFLTAPQRPDHIILITAGPLNRELKLWVSSSEEGWLLPSDAESWRCNQTLQLKSSSEQQNEEAFFNQVVGLSQAGLILLANAKKNAIYAVHLDYGANPLATHMDYLAEFTVTMPILSFTGTSDVSSNGEHVVQVYCVQTQAIQQYALDLSQCLPHPMENSVLEKSDSSVSRDAIEVDSALEPPGSKSFDVGSVASSAPVTSTQINLPGSTSDIKCPVSSAFDGETVQGTSSSGVEHNPSSIMPAANHVEVASVPSPSLPLSPKLSHRLSDLEGDQVVTDYSVDRKMDGAQIKVSATTTSSDDNRTALGNSSDVHQPLMFKHPTHLITPSEIMATTSSETNHATETKGEGEPKIQDVLVNADAELEVKVVDEAGLGQHGGSSSQREYQSTGERREKSFYSQASDLGVDVSRECSVLPTENSFMEEARSSIMEALSQPSNSGDEDVDGRENDSSAKSADFSVSAGMPQSPLPSSKGKKQKGKSSQASVPAQSSSSVLNSVDMSSVPPLEAALPQIQVMQEMINQLVSTQKEMQKQMTMMVAVPVTKEGRRLEAALGRHMEKSVKANADALWARIQEENAKQEKLLRDRTQQITNLISNCFNKDLQVTLERSMKKEIAAVSSNVARSITPVVEKTISSTISESFQRGVNDKAVNQLERSVSSKLEATVARQIQSQFQTSGKQALQDGLKLVLEASLIPAFELSCKAMFEQVDAAFQKGLVEYTSSAQHQLESAHSPLAMALRDAINSASSVTKTLSGELADGQRKLMALVAAGVNPSAGNPLVTQASNGPLIGLHEKVEQPFDPTKELSRLISEHKYEEAFTAALQRSDLSIVSWLCSQVDLHGLLSMVPLPVSQGVLLSLLQQLSCDTGTNMAKKLTWLTDVAIAINPSDPMIAAHVRPIFEQVYSILNHYRTLPTTSAAELSSIRVVMHVINSMLMNCK